MDAAAKSMEAPESAVTRVAVGGDGDRRLSMSARLWDIDWKSVLPWKYDDVSVEYETLADVLPFIADLFPETFNTDGQWLKEEATEAKRRFGEEMDVFVFRIDGKIVGFIAGHPSDWSTYYWRTVAVLPEYRQRNILTAFGERCYAPFRDAGVKRMEVDTSPANRATVRLFTNQGFIVTSTIASERWGLSLRFTKFLDEEAERVYTRQFLDVPAYNSKERRAP